MQNRLLRLPPNLTLNVDRSSVLEEQVMWTLRLISVALLGLGLALGGCGGSEASASTKKPSGPYYEGCWFQDGAVRSGSSFLELMPNGEFVYQRTMAAQIKTPTHRGQWRIDGATGQIRIFKFLSAGGTAHKPFAAFKVEWPYLIPINHETGEKKGRHYVKRETIPSY
ncbi:MAG: hypothetical protein AAGB34_11215, partial [Planctomycetota bacterium]